MADFLVTSGPPKMNLWKLLE